MTETSPASFQTRGMYLSLTVSFCITSVNDLFPVQCILMSAFLISICSDGSAGETRGNCRTSASTRHSEGCGAWKRRPFAIATWTGRRIVDEGLSCHARLLVCSVSLLSPCLLSLHFFVTFCCAMFSCMTPLLFCHAFLAFCMQC